MAPKLRAKSSTDGKARAMDARRGMGSAGERPEAISRVERRAAGGGASDGGRPLGAFGSDQAQSPDSTTWCHAGRDGGIRRRSKDAGAAPFHHPRA
jgi:hypothetical protein